MGLSRFTVKEPQLTDLNNGYYQLEESFIYTTDKSLEPHASRSYIQIPPFITDLSSHPKWSRWLIPDEVIMTYRVLSMTS